MESADAKILLALQADSSRSIATLAEQLSMSSSACHRHIRALEQRGVIEGYSARLNPRSLGLRLDVLVEITLSSQSREAMEAFEQATLKFDEILECNLISGENDYSLRIAARDLDHYDELHRNCLSRLPGVSSMRSSFSIRQVKKWSGYPVGTR